MIHSHKCARYDPNPNPNPKLWILRIFRVHDNYLTNVPSTMGSLTEMRELRVDGNRLRDLPDSLETMAEVNMRSCQHMNIRLCCSWCESDMVCGWIRVAVQFVCSRRCVSIYMSPGQGDERPRDVAGLHIKYPTKPCSPGRLFHVALLF